MAKKKHRFCCVGNATIFYVHGKKFTILFHCYIVTKVNMTGTKWSQSIAIKIAYVTIVQQSQLSHVGCNIDTKHPNKAKCGQNSYHDW